MILLMLLIFEGKLNFNLDDYHRLNKKSMMTTDLFSIDNLLGGGYF